MRMAHARAYHNLSVMLDRFDNHWWHEGPHPPKGPPGPPPEVAKFERTWSIMKSARFNAAKRFEKKHSASTLSIAIAGIVGIVIPTYPWVFEVSRYTENVLDYTGFMISVLSMTLGLYDHGKDHSEKKRQFHECGKAINKAVRRLGVVATHAQLKRLIADYENAIEGCSDNHDSLDYEIGRVHWELKSASGGEQDRLRKDLRRLKRDEWCSIFWLYGLVWLTPLIVGGFLLWFHPTPMPA